MREILFRGKRTDNGEWVEGDLFHNHDGRVFVGELVVDDYTEGRTADRYTLGIDFAEVIPETVGQFVGKTTESGVKIFDGDILEHPNKAVSIDRYVVKWDDVLGAWMAKWTEGAGGVYIGVASMFMELVGSIHDIPEPLEVADHA